MSDQHHAAPEAGMTINGKPLRPGDEITIDGARYVYAPDAPATEARCEWCGGPHDRDVFHAADLPTPRAGASDGDKCPLTGMTMDEMRVALFDARTRLATLDNERVLASLRPTPPPAEGAEARIAALRSAMRRVYDMEPSRFVSPQAYVDAVDAIIQSAIEADDAAAERAEREKGGGGE